MIDFDSINLLIEMFEVVNFVATTHLIGQKRCYRGDGSQTSFYVRASSNRSPIVLWSDYEYTDF